MHDLPPLLTASRFKSVCLGALVTFAAMPCEVTAKTKHSVTLKVPDAPKGKQLRKVSLIQLRTKDKQRREAHSAFVQELRTGPKHVSQYFPTAAQVEKMNPTYI